MKQIPKKLLDEVIGLSREYWATGGTTVLQERIKVAMEIKNETKIDWLAIIDFVDSIIRDTGICPNASNKMIYFQLRALGWEVADEVKESESV